MSVARLLNGNFLCKENVMLPDKLRLVDGVLVCADGSNVQEYLRAWAYTMKVMPDTPVNLMTRDDAEFLVAAVRVA